MKRFQMLTHKVVSNYIYITFSEWTVDTVHHMFPVCDSMCHNISTASTQKHFNRMFSFSIVETCETEPMSRT